MKLKSSVILLTAVLLFSACNDHCNKKATDANDSAVIENPSPRPVRARRDGTGDRLRVDIPEIGHGQSQRPEERIEIGQPRACEHPHATGLPVHRRDALQPLEVDLKVVGHSNPAEGMPRPHRFDPPAGDRSPPDHVRELVHAGWCGDFDGGGALVAGPVAPVPRTGLGPVHPKFCPSPR